MRSHSWTPRVLVYAATPTPNSKALPRILSSSVISTPTPYTPLQGRGYLGRFLATPSDWLSKCVYMMNVLMRPWTGPKQTLAAGRSGLCILATNPCLCFGECQSHYTTTPLKRESVLNFLFVKTKGWVIGGSPCDALTYGLIRSSGFEAGIRLWKFSSDLLLKIRLIEDAHSRADAPSSPMTELHQALSYLYVRFATCLDDLPPYLQPEGGISASDCTSAQRRRLVRIADLQVTYHCLKMHLTQKLEGIGHFEMSGESGDMLVLRKTEIARDMTRFLQSAPFWSLQVNGEPCVRENYGAARVCVFAANIRIG